MKPRKPIDAAKLRELTNEAIRKGEEEKRRIEAKKLAAEQKKREADEIKAQRVIEDIPDRAEKEATAGRSFAIVYSLNDYSDYDRDGNLGWGSAQNKTLHQRLKGVGKLVWDYCEEAGLKPAIEDWHDGVGMNSGYNIIIRW